jgi:hypothetical protein
MYHANITSPQPISNIVIALVVLQIEASALRYSVPTMVWNERISVDESYDHCKKQTKSQPMGQLCVEMTQQTCRQWGRILEYESQSLKCQKILESNKKMTVAARAKTRLTKITHPDYQSR